MHFKSCVNWLKLIFLALTLGNVGAKVRAVYKAYKILKNE